MGKVKIAHRASIVGRAREPVDCFNYLSSMMNENRICFWKACGMLIMFKSLEHQCWRGKHFKSNPGTCISTCSQTSKWEGRTLTAGTRSKNQDGEMEKFASAPKRTSFPPPQWYLEINHSLLALLPHKKNTTQKIQRNSLQSLICIYIVGEVVCSYESNNMAKLGILIPLFYVLCKN